MRTIALRNSTPRPKSKAEEMLALHLRAERIGGWVREFVFAPPRKWSLDFAWPERGLAVEVEGGIWIGGRHTRGQGYEDDCAKYNAAALCGYRVLRVTPDMVESGTAIATIRRALDA